MSLLDRYLCREVAAYALLALGVLTFLLLLPDVLRLSVLVAGHSASLAQLARLFLAVLPEKLVWTLPLSVLIGLLVGLSRLAADSEIVALQAAGVGLGRLLRPVLLFAGLGCGLTLGMTLWGVPSAARTLQALQKELAAQQALPAVQPRVFEERFEKNILYIHDLEAGRGGWRGVFLADVAKPRFPRITLAREGVPVPERSDRLRLHLRDGTTHETARTKPDEYSVSRFEESDVTVSLPVEAGRIRVRRNSELGLGELWAASLSGAEWRRARADFHQRLVFPAACLAFALIGSGFGLLYSYRSGRMVGLVAAVAIGLAYYFLYLVCDTLARQGNLAPGPALWAPNLATFAAGWLLLARLRKPGEPEWRLRWLGRAGTEARALTVAAAAPARPAGAARFWGIRLLDVYVARGAVFYLIFLLASLLALFELFALLEVVDDIAQRGIPTRVVAGYLWNALPQAAYWMGPLAVLLAVLVQLSLLSKRNELVAVRSAGVSLYRLVVPLLFVGLAVGALLFWLDDAYLPYANQRAQALRNQILGRPPQTVSRTQRRWIVGEGPRIYTYRFFDPEKQLFSELTVYEMDWERFALNRRLFAERAYWEDSLGTWVLQEGWERTFDGEQTLSYQAFSAGHFPELTEKPGYFRKELRESALMDWAELGAYIDELRQSGFDTTGLEVQRHRKLAFPLVSAIIVLVAFPFGLTMGRRGALGGLALGVATGFVYWFLVDLFQRLGSFALLTPLLAGWGADLTFALAAVYLLFTIET